MDVYRLSNARRADDLTGTGARLIGGRWNYMGTPVLYTASSRSLATLEVLVHSPLSYVPDYHQMLIIRVPEDSILSVPLDQLPDGWNGLTPPGTIKDITEKWTAEHNSLLLKVPSAMVEGKCNYLINPMHPRASEVVITNKHLYHFDPRLLR
ncbi:RES family NAD+ phosphorylase [Spirosoma endophyticum]|uniref:RES domain-containing protein n=1 Tax=Spirosoma endophyticum TaxID=662367 RepID=A0A1I1N0U3_9BACT|nr:RES family NAD+ phosphorylase [Spirosoma endophyticum]SFC90966.1 RES domain-containing protein [Spirosoma endophyticum]